MELTHISELSDPSGSVIFMDTETNGLHYMTSNPFLLTLGIGKNIHVIQWTSDLAQWLNEFLSKMNLVVFHNAKYDLHMFIQGGVFKTNIDKTKIFCTMVAEALIDEHQHDFSLDALGKKHFGIGKDTDKLFSALTMMFGGKPNSSQMKNLFRAPSSLVIEYAVDEMHILKMLYEKQISELRRQELESLMKLEMEVTKALIDMERRGVPVDLSLVPEANKRLKRQLQSVSNRLNDLVGFELNVLSQSQLIRAFEHLNIPVPVNDGGNISFAKEHLIDLIHPIAKDILQARMLRKGSDTFISNIYTYSIDNKIYTNFHQTRDDGGGVGTGRLSSSNPNMQQAPRRDKELGSIIRSLFKPRNGNEEKWVCGDWSQFEFRIFAHYSGDVELINQYIKNPNIDFHQTVSDMTGVPRNPFAKQINLGLIFGMGEGKLAQQLNLPYTKETNSYGRVIFKPGLEALEIFNAYHTKFPGAKNILKRAANLARERGYVKTIFGRRIRFQHKWQTYKAGGLIFQGTAADLMKLKLVELNNELLKIGGELVLSVHDEYDVIVPNEQVKTVQCKMKEIMENIPQLKVPMLAKIKVANDWWQASHSGEED